MQDDFIDTFFFGQSDADNHGMQKYATEAVAASPPPSSMDEFPSTQLLQASQGPLYQLEDRQQHTVKPPSARVDNLTETSEWCCLQNCTAIVQNPHSDLPPILVEQVTIHPPFSQSMTKRKDSLMSQDSTRSLSISFNKEVCYRKWKRIHNLKKPYCQATLWQHTNASYYSKCYSRRDSNRRNKTTEISIVHRQAPCWCAPTGSGKTVIFELAIIRLLVRLGNTPVYNAKIVYMAPMKALCSERYLDWKEKFGPLGLKCQELTGGLRD
ncbi:ATP-dependent DNA helicase MER3 [Branchiostoma belcheri]|nr:ATP-dependent DNA helicase MER3 [Branchiostoma belcheri]